MKQILCRNQTYEIQTPNGWELFSGIFKNYNCNADSRRIKFSNGICVTATLDHRFYTEHNLEIYCKDIDLSSKICYYNIVNNNIELVNVISIEDIVLTDTFDIFNAENHVVLVNGGVLSHQCDELAFLSPTVAKDFWTSLSPTLSTGGKVIVTSTPSSDEDQFAEIWFGANKMIDSNGNETEVGVNGFRPYLATWRAHPERDDAWASTEESSIGPDRFRREHNCITGSSVVQLLDENGNQLEITIEQLYNQLRFSLESQQVQASELIENQEDWSSGLKKFTKSLDVTDWQVDSGQGWVDVTHWNETVEYPVWRLETNTGSVLKAADTHILIREDGSEIFLRDCLGVKLQTVSGLETVMSVEPTGETAVMYDLTVDSPDHTYYTNGILSHNTTVAAGYLLWYAMFNDDSTILIASNKFDGAQEIMHRVRYAYESIPDHIRAGVRTYNKRSIDFDNGSRIVATATTENTGRGMSLSLIYCLGGENTVEIRNKTSGQESVVRLDELFDLLNT